MTDKERIKAYVIKRDDGMYLHYDNITEYIFWFQSLSTANMYELVDDAYLIIANNGLANCQVVPITIQEGEDNEAVEALSEVSRRLYESHYHDEGENRYSVYMEEVEAVIDQLIKKYGVKNE